MLTRFMTHTLCPSFISDFNKANAYILKPDFYNLTTSTDFEGSEKRRRKKTQHSSKVFLISQSYLHVIPADIFQLEICGITNNLAKRNINMGNSAVSKLKKSRFGGFIFLSRENDLGCFREPSSLTEGIVG